MMKTSFLSHSMKIIALLPFFISILFCLVSIISPTRLYAELDSYTPLAPLPGTTNSTGTTNLSTYLPGLYKLGVGFAGVLAVLMITWGGIEYMVSEAVSSKSAAKGKIYNALTGLLLAFLSYIILYTINPKLVNLQADITPTEFQDQNQKNALVRRYIFNTSPNNPTPHCNSIGNLPNWDGTVISTVIGFQCGSRQIGETGRPESLEFCCEYKPPGSNPYER